MVEIAIVGIFYIFEVLKPNAISQDWFTIRICGYCKAAITLIKYMPQVYLNFSRKSTVGWSIENIILDFFGGFFSFMQILFKVLKVNSDYEFNIVKFLLSVIAMAFDLIFMF
jgi:cystinosin